MSELHEHDLYEDVSNPLDSVEEILYAHDWVFDRTTEDELNVNITGKMGEYQLHFQWQEEYSAMLFTCTFDLNVRAEAADETARIMTAINSDLWLGHFDFCPGTQTPRFRHTTLFRGMTQTSGVEHLEDLVDIALAECERFYPVFDLYTRNALQDENQLALALMPIAGES